MSRRAKVISRKTTTKKGDFAPKAKKSDLFSTKNSPVDQVLNLQRVAGNQAVQGLFKSGTVQPKLKIGRPGDKYELEADRIAEKVMRMPDSVCPTCVEEDKEEVINRKVIRRESFSSEESSFVQRQVGEDERKKKEEEEIIQTKPISEQISPLVQRQVEDTERKKREEEELVQPKLLSNSIEPVVQRRFEEEEMLQTKENGSSTAEVTPGIESGINSLKSGGQTLPESMRNYFEPRFGYDFGGVRVHTGVEANETAKSINARAFTIGNKVVFSTSSYSPETVEGKKILVHELTHVIQQENRGSRIQRKIAVDPSRFAGDKAAEELLDFKKMIVDELKTITGLELDFSGNVLSSKTDFGKGGSKTAAMVLNMAIKAGETIFIDPREKLGAEHTKRGIEISTKKVPIRLKSMRSGIVIIHELAHHFADKLKAPDYDEKMKTLKEKAEKGGNLTAEEAELLLWYNPRDVQSDENIPVSIANKIRDELNLIRRIHYSFHIEYPTKPDKTGLDKYTSYTEFKTTDSPPIFLYLDVLTWDLYSSKIDYFQELIKTGKPPIPKPSEFNKIVKGTSYYDVVKKNLL